MEDSRDAARELGIPKGEGEVGKDGACAAVIHGRGARLTSMDGCACGFFGDSRGVNERKGIGNRGGVGESGESPGL